MKIKLFICPIQKSLPINSIMIASILILFLMYISTDAHLAAHNDVCVVVECEKEVLIFCCPDDDKIPTCECTDGIPSCTCSLKSKLEKVHKININNYYTNQTREFCCAKTQIAVCDWTSDVNPVCRCYDYRF